MLRGDLTTLSSQELAGLSGVRRATSTLGTNLFLTGSAQENVLVGGSRNDDSEIQLLDPRGLSRVITN